MAVRKQITKAQLEKWPKATKREKGEILDRVCGVTGWHRDHARKAIRLALNGESGQQRQPREPALVYGPEVIDALVQCWSVLDGPSGKVLRPALPAVVQNLRQSGRLDIDDATAAKLTTISAATIDRRLAPARAELQIPGKGRSMTKPGSMLKSKITMKTWAEWDGTIPGFVQIDLVGHDGGDNNGPFCYTLSLTDVATGWVAAATIRSKGERTVATALSQLVLTVPFHVAGIHSDNGSEFINHHLKRWSEARQITFTRSRANHSNDNAHVEQKNWSWIRRCAGYFRYDSTTEAELLNQLWPQEAAVMNLFKPQQKLTSKTRTGAKVTKKHDTATTPLDRLLNNWPELIDPHDLTELNNLRNSIDLYTTRINIAATQDQLVHRAKQRGPVPHRPNRHHVYDSQTKTSRPPRTRAKLSESTNHHTRAS